MEKNQTMKASELRIGNYYNQFGNTEKVCHVVIKNLTEAPDGQLWCKPIPLTEEWLLRMGVEVYEFDNGEPNQYRLKSRLIVIRENSFCDYGSNVKIKYVHSLQNLYFALTNQELEIKES